MKKNGTSYIGYITRSLGLKGTPQKFGQKEGDLGTKRHRGTSPAMTSIGRKKEFREASKKRDETRLRRGHDPRIRPWSETL